LFQSAILRAIPSKVGGVLAMGGAIAILLLLPFINTSEVRSSAFRPIYIHIFWLFFFNFLLLGWLGQAPIEDPFIILGQLGTVFYFLVLLVFIPLIGILESFLIKVKTA
jgi:ubiquinol-cytochrome c reductase cytochrome b subunit